MTKVSWTRKKLILKIAVIAIAAMFFISFASPTTLVEYPNGTSFVTEEEHGLVKDTYVDRPCIVKAFPAEGGTWVSLDGGATPAGTPAKGCAIVSDPTGITIAVNFFGFWRNTIGINGTTYDDIVMPGATQNHENATPMIPMLSEFIEIPHCTDVSIEWISSSSALLSNYYIRPAPPPQVPVTFEGNGSADYYMPSVYGVQFATAYLPTKEGPAYSNNAFFPDNASVISIEGEECANPVIMRGHRLLTLNTYGAQYNNPSHELRVYSQIVFKIKYSYETQIEPIPESLRSEVFERILFDFLLNYDPINIRTGSLSNIPGLGEVRPDTGRPGTRTTNYPLPSQPQIEATDYSLSSGSGAWTTNYPLASQPQVETTDYSLSSGPQIGIFNFPLASDPPPGYVEGAEYLILTSSALVEQAERLAAWKTRKGTPSKVIPVNPSITEIAAIISNAYDTWYPAPTYVVFFGDVEIIPATYNLEHQAVFGPIIPGLGEVRPDRYPGTLGATKYPNAPADLKMFDPDAGLPEDIASDLGYFAIDGPDYIPDYIYGRISVDDATEAGIVVDKILQYEQSPPTVEDFYTDILTAGKFEDIAHSGVEDPSFPFIYNLETIRHYLDFYRDYDVDNVYSCTGTSPDDAANEWFMPLEFYTTLQHIESNLIEDSDLQYTVDQPPEYEIYDWLSAYHEYGNMMSGAQRIADSINLGKFLVLYYGHGGSENMVYRYDTNGNSVWDIDDRDQVNGWLTPYFDTSQFDLLYPYDPHGNPFSSLFISMACNTGWYDGEVDQGWLDLDEYYQPGDEYQDGVLMPVGQSIVNPFLERSTECFAEEITRLDKGAIAAISSSRLAYSVISGYLLDGIIEALWPGLFECQEGNLELGEEPLSHPIHNMGATLLLGKLIAAKQWGRLHDAFEVAQTTFEGYLLFGDPETKLWTENPTEIDVSYPASIGTTEHQRFAVTVTDSISGDAVKYAKVCLHQEGDDGPIVYEVGYTDANGQAVFDIDPGVPISDPTDPQVDVTVTKHNVRPHIGAIDVISGSASVSVSPQAAEGGEILVISFSGFTPDMSITILVDGQLLVTGLSSSASPYFWQVFPGDTRYMNIQVRGVDGTFGVSVDCFQRLGAPDLYLYSQDDSSTWYGRGLTWDNPDIEIYRDGEQQLRLEQYEENTVRVTVHNRGSYGSGYVGLYYAPFGDTSNWEQIEYNETVFLDHDQSTTLEWTFTPTLPSTCLRAMIYTSVNAEFVMLAGYECLGYVEMSTTGELSFDVVNPTAEPIYATFNIKQLGDYVDVWSATILDYSPQLIAPDESGTFRLYIDTMSSPAGLGREFEVEVTTCKGNSLGGMTFNATEYTTVVPEGIFTPVGQDITVTELDLGVSVTFDDVDEAGGTTIDVADLPIGAPGSVAGTDINYDISTTAEIPATADITIAIQYDETTFNNEANLELMHWDSVSSKWEKITTTLDTTANIIEGVTDSLSPFALMEIHPIYINGDGDFAAYGFPGDGVTEPYRIENYLIVGSEELIHIQYTTKSFIITGCQLDGEDGTHNGITLLNVIVGEIFDNYIENCFTGIHIEGCSNIWVEANDCSGNRAGIYLGNSNGNDVVHNTCNDNLINGIQLYNSHVNDVLENTCNGNGDAGIFLLGSNTNVITGNMCNGNGDAGILLRISNNNEVTENICEHNSYAGIYLDQANGNNVSRNTCDYNTIHGIHVLWSESNTIANNSCSGSDHYGIRVEFSNNNIVVYNTCSSNTIVGIELSDSHYNTVASNTCNNQDMGINIILDSNHNEILENTCTDDTGINLISSSLNVVSDNDCSGSIIGISIGDSNNNQVIGNDCSECELYGIILDTCTSSVLISNTCNENEIGILLIFSDEIDVIENTCNDNGQYGILLNESSLNLVADNLCNGNGNIGIYLANSHENEINGNTCYYNDQFGILLSESNLNVISGNDCSDNWLGIYLYNSDECYVAGNICNYNFLDGIYLSGVEHNTVERNTCNENERRGITLNNSHNNIITDNSCNENGEQGIIIFYGSTNNEVVDNTFNLNHIGVGIGTDYIGGGSDSNVVKYNTIAENDYGFYLIGSSSNLFYYNTISDNTIQAVDEGSPSGNNWYNPSMLKGNYWSDYPGEDLDGDGVGDTDVAWPGPGFDMYPLMIDSDNDGLPDSVELSLGTDPANPDTDNDAWRDGDEYYYLFTDPLVPDAYWPTVSGQPLFTLHILVAEESEIAILRAEYLARDLHCIGIEVVIHILPWQQWIPTLTNPEDYGLTRPSPDGPPIWDDYNQIYVGFDAAVLGIGSNGYISRLELDSIYNNLNQGYNNPEYEALVAQLEALNIDWNANWPDPPALSGEALDILHQLQEIWAEDQPFWVTWGRDHWDVGSDETGWAVALSNHGNEHLALPEVRQAVNLVMWRQLMVHAGLTRPWQIYLVQTPMLPTFPGYDSVSDAYRNVLLARVLLYNAGYTDIIIDSDHDGWTDYDEVYTIFTDPHELGPFFIDGDAQLLAMDEYHGWDGSGNYGDPIIIEGYDIDVNGADASCIKILNIESTYFIVRDCTVTGTSVPEGGLVEIPFIDAYAGIWLSNVRYAELTNNYCFGNCYGIRVDYSYGVTITDNHCYSNDWEGIAVLLDSTECVVTDNYCFDNVGLLGNGIGVGVGAYHNQIVHNFVYDNLGDEGAGIHLFLGYDNTIIDNDCYGNYWGIAVRGTSSDNDILDNDCWDNYQAIFIQNSDSNTVTGNDCFSNDFEGIVVVGDSNLNTVSDNWCYDNDVNGIGVGLGATDNTIENNHAYNNGYAGIHFWNGDDNTVRGNECYDNEYGISMRGGSSGNDILENIFTSNTVGIYLFEGSSNTIFHNSIIYNTIQALDEDPVGDNFWYSPTLLEGNIWSDYIGVDFDRDGIGDTDIPWPAEGYDLYPLVTDDFDNDGLSYYAELVIGTDPYNDDTDGDYFKDGDEWRYFFSDPIVPETPSEVSEIIDSSLDELVDEGILEQKDTNPLLKKLDAARDLMDRGKLSQAIQKLGDFIDQINAMINRGKLTEEEGNALIALAQTLIDVILTM